MHPRLGCVSHPLFSIFNNCLFCDNLHPLHFGLGAIFLSGIGSFVTLPVIAFESATLGYRGEIDSDALGVCEKLRIA